MIPPFDERGNLPPGVHLATLEEIEARFGQTSELRQVQMQSLHWLVDIVRRVGISRLVINGSFVTDEFEPNDVDCVLLAQPGLLINPADRKELRAGLPFLGIDLVNQQGFDLLIGRFFSSDRQFIAKGMIEVEL